MAIFFIVMGWLAAGIVVFGVLLGLICALILYGVYRKNNYSLPRKVFVVVGIIIGLIIFAVFIASLILDSFNAFAGFSISYMTYFIIQAGIMIKTAISDYVDKSKVNYYEILNKRLPCFILLGYSPFINMIPKSEI